MRATRASFEDDRTIWTDDKFATEFFLLAISFAAKCEAYHLTREDREDLAVNALVKLIPEWPGLAEKGGKPVTAREVFWTLLKKRIRWDVTAADRSIKVGITRAIAGHRSHPSADLSIVFDRLTEFGGSQSGYGVNSIAGTVTEDVLPIADQPIDMDIVDRVFDGLTPQQQVVLAIAHFGTLGREEIQRHFGSAWSARSRDAHVAVLNALTAVMAHHTAPPAQSGCGPFGPGLREKVANYISSLGTTQEDLLSNAREAYQRDPALLEDMARIAHSLLNRKSRLAA